MNKLIIILSVSFAWALKSYGAEVCIKLNKNNIYKVVAENKDSKFFALYRLGTNTNIDGVENFSVTTQNQSVAKKIDQVIANLKAGAEAKSFCFKGADHRNTSALLMDVTEFNADSSGNKNQNNGTTSPQQ